MQFLRNLWSFIRSRVFLFNMLGAIVFYVGIILLFALFVRSYTKHGQSISVPDLTGKTIDDAVKLIGKSGLEYKISDSSYDGKKEPLAVLDQNPKPASKVKADRTIYLTVNSKKAPQVKMPDLKDASLKQATMILETYSMKVGQLIYKPDLAKNVVLDQLYDGKPIAPGSDIQKGSTIDLVLGDGLGQTKVDVPNLVGLSLREAKFVLEGSSLNLGAVVNDQYARGDSMDAIIYRQAPDASASEVKTLNVGEGVDVFVTSPEHYSKTRVDSTDHN